MHVLVDHECRTLRVVGNTLPDLPIGGGGKRMLADGTINAMTATRVSIPNRPELAEEVKQLLCGYVVASKEKSAINLVTANGITANIWRMTRCTAGQRVN